jgi:serine/threonine protein kinase
MADVYRATDLLHESQRPVAVKLLRAGPLADEILRESFRRETMALRELVHEHIVQLLDAGTRARRQAGDGTS